MPIASTPTDQHASPSQPSLGYLVLIAFTISTVALATDVMLPAMSLIGHHFALQNMNDTQYVVSTFFAGFAIGQLVVGPLSDSFGRRPVIIWGYVLFLMGCALSILASSWAMMLIGRVLQGLGASAPRIVAVAIVRDEYKGRIMARIMSVVMAVFIIVPALSPALGQAMIYLGGWRAAFLGLVMVALPTMLWFMARMPETLHQDRRRPFSISSILKGLVVIINTRVTLGYTCASGLAFGLFLGYLSTAQQIFQTTYITGDYFALYFGLAALSIGGASFFNSRLVMWLGMRRLSLMAVIGLSLWSGGFLILMTQSLGGMPSLLIFMIWLLAAFFCIGIMFGNLMALAMEPLGDFAGLGSAFVGALSTMISLPLGWMISDAYDGTVYALVTGFTVLANAAWLVMVWTDWGHEVKPS
jgi:DHA1 family bicyclomycin/chloramphenicol resistance-like MFS transporter